jgi:hypothetical protein
MKLKSTIKHKSSKHKFIRKTKKGIKYVKIGDIKKTNKSSKTYIIVKCLYNIKKNINYNIYLNYNALEKHLNKLGIQEHTAKRIIDKLDYAYLKQNKIPIIKYCEEKLHLPSIAKLNLKYCDFMWIDLNLPFFNRYYNVKKYLINMINKDKLNLIYDKSELYNNFKIQSPDTVNLYMAYTFNILEKDNYKLDGKNYYILRPIDSSGGSDIIYISTLEELKNALEYYKSKRNFKNIIYGSNVIASKYIINPYLFKGKKFHIRIHYMISYIEGVFNSFLLDNGQIITSKYLYDIDKPFTKDKHDTHFKTTDDDYNYPQDLEKYDNIKENKTKIDIKQFHKYLRTICKTLSQILFSDKKPYTYDTEKNGFKLFGIDIMIDADTMKPILIECNIRPSYGFKYTENRAKFLNIFFKWINDVILEPTFKFKDQYIARKHPTYINI